MGTVTYTGYDKDGNVVGSRTSENADSYIDLSSIKTNSNKVSSVMEEQINKIQKALREIVDDANQALVVNSTKIGPSIEDFIDSLEGLKGTVSSDMSSIYTSASSAHSSKQKRFNEIAYDAVWRMSGVVKVR